MESNEDLFPRLTCFAARALRLGRMGPMVRSAAPGRPRFHRARTHLQRMAELTVWYDGSCPLCQQEIALLRRLDRRGAIGFVDASQADQEGCPLDKRDLLARFHASEGGRILSGAAAFAAVWRAIPMLRPLGLLFRGRFALALLERFYLVFLRVRPALQKLIRRLERP